MNDRTVAAVVTTMGRVSLRAALDSTRRQTRPPDEVLVVHDGTAPLAPDARAALGADVTVIETGGGCGPAGARMAGVRAATSALVAFLDDDDVWLPHKLADQLVRYDAESDVVRYPVVGGLAIDVDPAGRALSRPRASGYAPGGDDLAEALFVRTSLRHPGGRLALGASVLLADRALLLADPMCSDWAVHEDWEWLLRVERRGDARVSVVDHAVLHYGVDVSAGSQSRRAGAWWSSSELAERAPMSRRARGELVLGVGASTAIAAGARADAVRLARRAWAVGRPSARAWVAFVIQLALPRRLLMALRREPGVA